MLRFSFSRALRAEERIGRKDPGASALRGEESTGSLRSFTQGARSRGRQRAFIQRKQLRVAGRAESGLAEERVKPVRGKEGKGISLPSGGRRVQCRMKAAVLCILPWLALAQRGHNPCAAATWTADLAQKAGERATLRMEGTVFLPDGKTPAAGIIMYVYQTGLDGKYGSDGRGGPRLRAWIRTDSMGRYRYHTIMPAPYPDGSTPAHIHVHFWGPKAPQQYFDVYFEHDPQVGEPLRAAAKRAGQFASVVRLTPGESAMTGRQDFRLKAKADRFEASIRHGVDACR